MSGSTATTTAKQIHFITFSSLQCQESYRYFVRLQLQSTTNTQVQSDSNTMLRNLVLFVTTVAATNPSDGLECYATLAPQKKIICPYDRMSHCIKESVSSTRNECGSTASYPFDEWDVKGGLCVYRKCGNSCQNETVIFKGRDGLNNSRSTHCCESDLCNAGSFLQPFIIIFFQAVFSVGFLIIF